MKTILGWLLAPVLHLLEGGYTSGIESCEYCRRLSSGYAEMRAGRPEDPETERAAA